MKVEQKYMLRCIQLAKNGLGTTAPNPMVGSVIVHKDIIIGEGWHHKAGEAHAEVNAIKSVTDKQLLKEATIYVSLEPCSHQGKTPPCANLIIENSIKKVVVGSLDPNPKVAGKGIQRLLDAGCEVTTEVMLKECNELNKRFFTYHLKKRPYIFLKWAETEDGFIAPVQREMKAPVWITSKYSRQIAHKMRAQEQAILVGTTTVIEDNPSLTTRNWHGSSPLRVILDKNLKIPKDLSIYNQAAETLIINDQLETDENGTFYRQIDFTKNIPREICDLLYKFEIQSLIIEGGSQTIMGFINSNLWDEAFIFKGNTTFDKGVKKPLINGSVISKTKIKEDTLTRYKNTNP